MEEEEEGGAEPVSRSPGMWIPAGVGGMPPGVGGIPPGVPGIPLAGPGAGSKV